MHCIFWLPSTYKTYWTGQKLQTKITGWYHQRLASHNLAQNVNSYHLLSTDCMPGAFHSTSFSNTSQLPFPKKDRVNGWAGIWTQVSLQLRFQCFLWYTTATTSLLLSSPACPPLPLTTKEHPWKKSNAKLILSTLLLVQETQRESDWELRQIKPARVSQQEESLTKNNLFHVLHLMSKIQRFHDITLHILPIEKWLANQGSRILCHHLDNFSRIGCETFLQNQGFC